MAPDEEYVLFWFLFICAVAGLIFYIIKHVNTGQTPAAGSDFKNEDVEEEDDNEHKEEEEEEEEKKKKDHDLTRDIDKLILAVREDNIFAVKQLIKKRADLVNAKNENGFTALIVAALNGLTEIVELLLEKGADINAKNDTDSTALTCAAGDGHTEIVELLLEKGAEINPESDVFNQTALALAAENGHTEIVELLLERGADVNARHFDETALMLAAENGHTEIVELLLEKGADVNAVCVGNTALTCAAKNGHTEIVELLLERGADVNVENRDGKTPLMLANEYGYESIIRMLTSGYKNKLQVGMTKEELIGYLGEPSNISDGSHRQIYKYGEIKGPRGGVTYVYEIIIKDGIVKSWKEN